MTERLFVYGSLAPGESNAHVLAGIDGTWEPATVTGTLHPEGWGATLGFPARSTHSELRIGRSDAAECTGSTRHLARTRSRFANVRFRPRTLVVS